MGVAEAPASPEGGATRHVPTTNTTTRSMNIKIHIVAEPASLHLAATLVDLDGGFRGRDDGRQALRRTLRGSGIPPVSREALFVVATTICSQTFDRCFYYTRLRWGLA